MPKDDFIMTKIIRVSLAGIGNAASAFVQSLALNDQSKINFLAYPEIGGYSLGSIKVVAAFDVAKPKIGKSLDEAIFASPNVTKSYVNSDGLDRFSDIKVMRGPLYDGVNETVKKLVEVDESSEVNVSEELKKAKTDILVWLGPSGAEDATYAYAQAAIDAKCAFINCTPAEVATNSEWTQKFKQAGLLLVGDDLQSQAGGTRIHKSILEVLHNFGVPVSKTYQLDISGGAEELASLDNSYRIRFAKSEIKSDSIRRSHPSLSPENIALGTADYLDFLGNERTGFFNLKAKDFLGGDITIDLTIRSDDGPNAAGTLVDVVRATKFAMNLALDSSAISGYGFKNPPMHTQEFQAGNRFRDFVLGNRST